VGILNFDDDFSNQFGFGVINTQTGCVGILGQQYRHFAGLQQQAGMDFVSHREIDIPVFVTGRQELQSAHIKDFNTLATAPEKLQIGVTSVGLKAPIKPSPRFIALQEQVQGIAIHGNPPGFSRL